jgi:hypothetical protein
LTIMPGAGVYSLFRKIHLYTGLSLLTFVVMYFISGYPMIHHDWFPNPDPVRSEREQVLAEAPSEPLREYAVYLQEQLDVPGKRTQARRLGDGRWRFRYSRPGTFHEVLVTADGKTAHVATKEENARTTGVGFHRMHGYGGGLLYDLWLVFYDLASLSLILFAISGVYLWWRLARRRWLGWAFLGVSWGYAAITVAYLVHAP